MGPPIEAATPFVEYITHNVGGTLEPAFNAMNLVLNKEGLYLSPEQFNIAYSQNLNELSALMDGLIGVAQSEAVDLGGLLEGEVDFSDTGRLYHMASQSAQPKLFSPISSLPGGEGPLRDLPHQSGGDYKVFQTLITVNIKVLQLLGTALDPVDFQASLAA